MWHKDATWSQNLNEVFLVKDCCLHYSKVSQTRAIVSESLGPRSSLGSRRAAPSRKSRRRLLGVGVLSPVAGGRGGGAGCPPPNVPFLLRGVSWEMRSHLQRFSVAARDSQIRPSVALSCLLLAFGLPAVSWNRRDMFSDVFCCCL